MYHTQTWWNYRHLENFLFVHYNDLLSDLPQEMQRMARFLDIPITDEAMAAILPTLNLETMRRNGEQTPFSASDGVEGWSADILL